MTLSTALIIFLPDPAQLPLEEGTQQHIGDEPAVLNREDLLAYTRSVTQEFPGERFLFYRDYPNWNDAWSISDYRKRIQQGVEPGERWAAAFASVLEEGHDSALIIGCNCPELSAAIIGQGAEALQSYDAVIGPAQDDRCYLLGIKGMNPAVLAAISSATGSVDSLRSLLQAQGLSCHMLPTLHML